MDSEWTQMLNSENKNYKMSIIIMLEVLILMDNTLKVKYGITEWRDRISTVKCKLQENGNFRGEKYNSWKKCIMIGSYVRKNLGIWRQKLPNIRKEKNNTEGEWTKSQRS